VGWRRIAAFVGVAAFLTTAAPAAAHDTSDPERRQREIRNQLGELRENLDEAAAAEAELLAELRVTRHTKVELDARVAELDQEVAAARAALRQAELTLEISESRYQAAVASLIRARRVLRAARDVLQEQAVAAFTRRGLESSAELQVLLNVRDIRQFHEIRAYVAAVADHQGDVVEEFGVVRDEVEDLTDERAAARDAATEKRSEVATFTAALEERRREQDQIRDRVAAEVDREEQLVSQIQAQRAEYQRRISSLQRESDQITDLLRRRQSGQGIGSCSGGRLESPMPGYRISSRYGWRTHPIFGGRRLHTGIDFAAPYGTPVRSAAGGRVIFTGWRGGYGNAVVVDHGGSLATLYAHLSRISVRTGGRLAPSQSIGNVGSTGFSTGPHLHFEVRVNGTPVDPLRCF